MLWRGLVVAPHLLRRRLLPLAHCVGIERGECPPHWRRRCVVACEVELDAYVVLEENAVRRLLDSFEVCLDSCAQLARGAALEELAHDGQGDVAQLHCDELGDGRQEGEGVEGQKEKAKQADGKHLRGQAGPEQRVGHAPVHLGVKAHLVDGPQEGGPRVRSYASLELVRQGRALGPDPTVELPVAHAHSIHPHLIRRLIWGRVGRGHEQVALAEVLELAEGAANGLQARGDEVAEGAAHADPERPVGSRQAIPNANVQRVWVV
mmetsp:Transcript_1141/g.3530  ORF Transcript_1141/g.3530 Transcript_1141/m.3530 type:complete len:264 (-) Transcript_1141:580-1371(-)